MEKKFTWVLIIGPPSVGKLTIAEHISKHYNYHLLHNHQFIDFLKNVMPETMYKERKILRYDLNLQFLKMFAKNKISSVITLAYAHDYVTEHKILFPDLVKKIERIATRSSGELKVIHLQANLDSLLKRVSMKNRRKYGKITSKVLLKKVYTANDFYTSPNVKCIKKVITDNTSALDVFCEAKKFIDKK